MEADLAHLNHAIFWQLTKIAAQMPLGRDRTAVMADLKLAEDMLASADAARTTQPPLHKPARVFRPKSMRRVQGPQFAAGIDFDLHAVRED